MFASLSYLFIFIAILNVVIILDFSLVNLAFIIYIIASFNTETISKRYSNL
uniref:Uncharacterized protein n=1 Tax=Rhizophagus irregularis (strain DAOM 181602 / DAOM 197198 / MUCL 43194) TaxID=747089 RepID=U9T257_RHIID